MKLSLFAVVAGLVGVVLITMPGTVFAHDVAAEIEKVKTATQKYNDVNVALAEGFIPAPPGTCISAASEGLPPEWGGMGIHYINPAMLKITATEPYVDGMSTHTDFMKPAILLYEPQKDGSLVLVGVENLVFKKAWRAAGNATPPKFAGRTWDTMVDDPSTPHHEAHMFEGHHDQHVYFRKGADVNGQLMPFSPSVSCENQKKS